MSTSTTTVPEVAPSSSSVLFVNEEDEEDQDIWKLVSEHSTKKIPLSAGV